MANSTDAATSAIDDRVSHQSVAATHTGDSGIDTETQATTNTKQSDYYQIVGQQANLLYTEDPGCIRRSKKFNIKNEDVLHAIEEQGPLQNLELLQVSRSNKSIEIRFDSEQTAQHFVECDIQISGNSFPFRRNAQRRLRVSIHGVHPNVPDAALEYELLQYYGGVLEIKRDTKQYKTKVYQTGPGTFLISELYKHIPRSCHIMNRWCLALYIILGSPTQPEKHKRKWNPDKIMNHPTQIKRNQCPPLTLNQTRRKISLMIDLMRVSRQWKRRTLVSLQKETLTENVNHQPVRNRSRIRATASTWTS